MYAEVIINSNAKAITTTPWYIKWWLKLIHQIIKPIKRISEKESNIDIANKLGVKEYSIKIAKQVGAKFTPAQLKRILDLGASLDYKIKSGQMNEKNALIYFVTNISGM